MSKFLGSISKLASVVSVVAGFVPGGQAIALFAAGTAALAGAASQATAKKPVNERQGAQLSWKIDKDAPIPYVMGRTAVGGTMVHRETYGTDNHYQTFFTVLSGCGPIHAIEAFTANREVVPFSGTGATGYYGRWMWQDRQLGQTNEPRALGHGIVNPPFGSVGAIPGWDAASKLSGYAATSLTLLFDTKSRRYSEGEPLPGYIVQGVLVYDPRLDSTYPGGSGPCRWAPPTDIVAHSAARATWVYSATPALHGLMWRLGRWERDESNPAAPYRKIMGVGASIDMIDVAAIVDSANVQEANGWTIGGQIDSAMERYAALKLIEEAGGARPIPNAARLSTMQVGPKVSLATIRAADLAPGKLAIAGCRPLREKINGYRARYRSEPHGWEMVPIDIVQVPAYVTADGRERTGSGDLALVQDPDQAASLSAYRVFDSRELEGIVLNLKPRWTEYRIGDCLTLDLPEHGLIAQPASITKRRIDPATAIVTLTFTTETHGKHAAALGLTGVVPPAVSLAARSTSVPAPIAGSWSVAGGQLTGSDGSAIPAVVLTGAVDNTSADAVVFEYRIVDAALGQDEGWIGAGIDPSEIVRREITGVKAQTSYQASVRYRVRGTIGARLVLGPVTTGGVAIDFDQVTGPNRPENGADVTADHPEAFRAWTGRSAAAVISDLDLNGRNWLDMATLESTRDALMLARTTLEGQPIGTAITAFKGEFQDEKSATAETFSLIGAKAGDGTGFVLDLASVKIGPADGGAGPVQSLGQRFQSISLTQGGLTASVNDLKSVLIDEQGTVTAKAVLALDVAGRVAGMVLTSTGFVSAIEMLFGSYNFLTPSGTNIFSYSDPAQGGDGKLYLPDVVVRTITYEAMVPLFEDRQVLDPNGWWQELPGGLIMQGGRFRASISRDTAIGIIFPRPFPNVVLSTGASAFLSADNRFADLIVQNLGEPSLQGTSFFAQATAGGNTAIQGIDWWAWGR